MRKNKSETAEYHRKWYQANRLKRIAQIEASNKKIEARNRAYVEDYLKAHPCIDCGEGDLVVLDFDHVRGKKEENVSTLVTSGVKLERIQREIAKCEVRCANCHRRITAKRRNQ